MCATISSCSSGVTRAMVEPRARQKVEMVSVAVAGVSASGVTKHVRPSKRASVLFSQPVFWLPAIG